MTDPAVPALTLPARVIQALLAGEQVVDIRRPGGDGPGAAGEQAAGTIGSARVESPAAGEQAAGALRSGEARRAGSARFWLVPAPGAEPALKPAYQRARELSLPGEEPPPGQVRIDGWAELAGTATMVVDEGAKGALDGKTVLALDPFDGQEVRVLALRAHRLVEPVTVPADGLAGLPADPAAGPRSEPALSDKAFEARYKGVNGSLPGGLTPAA